MVRETCRRDFKSDGKPWMLLPVCSTTADQTMVLWRGRTYGQMSRDSGSPCYNISASRRDLKDSPLNHMIHSHAAVGLGKSLFPLFARSLDLSPDFFDDKVRICRSLSSSRLEYVEQPMTQRETRHETRLRYYVRSIIHHERGPSTSV